MPDAALPSPALPLTTSDRDTLRAKGTEGAGGPIGPTLAPIWCMPGHSESSADGLSVVAAEPAVMPGHIGDRRNANEKRPLPESDRGRLAVGVTGFEPATSTSRT